MSEIIGLCIAVLFITICLVVLFVNQKRLGQEIKRVEWSIDKLREKLGIIELEVESLSRLQRYTDLCDSMSTEVSNLEEEIELSDDVSPIADTEKPEEEFNRSEDTSEEGNDNSQAYATLFLRECPLTQKFKVPRINNDIAEVMRIMLYDSGISTSSYVNNILAEHFKEHHIVLECKSREVAASLLDASL